MPATTARIGFIREQFRLATSEDPDVRARHGQDARQSDEPIETFFDNVADAQVMADRRQALLGREARRFEMRARGVEEAMALQYLNGSAPTAKCTDTEREAYFTGIVTEFSIDLGKQSQSFVVWG